MNNLRRTWAVAVALWFGIGCSQPTDVIGGEAPRAELVAANAAPVAYAPEFVAVLRGSDWTPSEPATMNMALVSGHLFFAAGDSLWTVDDPGKQDGKAFATRPLQSGLKAGERSGEERLFGQGQRLFYTAADGTLVGVTVPYGTYNWSTLPASESTGPTTSARQVSSGDAVFVAIGAANADAATVYRLASGAYSRELGGYARAGVGLSPPAPPAVVHAHPRPIVSVLSGDDDSLYIADTTGLSWRITKDGREPALAVGRVVGKELLRTGGFSYQLNEFGLYRVETKSQTRTLMIRSDRTVRLGAAHAAGGSLFLSRRNETDLRDCSIVEARTDGSTRTLAAGQNEAVAIDADATFVYWLTVEGALFRIHR